MADQDIIAKKAKKFLFDVNNFDAPEIEEDLPPPPPMFSEDELAQAKATSFDQGRAAGRGEADASREKYVAGVMDKVSAKLDELLNAETARAAAYEAEVVALAASIFAKLFPGLNERHGLAEIERVVADVLESQSEQPEIVLEVGPDDAEEVRAYIDGTDRGARSKGACRVQPNPALGKGDCRMYWNDGGAIRDIAGLTAQIAARLDETLEGRPRLRDNDNEAAEGSHEGRRGEMNDER
jgi:flagellar assembly protein FliH